MSTIKSEAGYNLKALIVEDNAHMRAMLRELLVAIGIRDVSEAAEGAAALRLLGARKCDLILSDLAMAPMDGIAFTRRIRSGEASANRFIPIIMVTGHTEKHQVEAARDAGVTEFVAKPLTPNSLYSRIAEIVERPRAFVRTATYFGPDRRRRTLDNHGGPWRRRDDYVVEEQNGPDAAPGVNRR